MVEIRDKLRDRYKLGLLVSPSHYDGCNNSFTTSRALACKVGGLIHSRHDESRDSTGYLACAGFQPSNVRNEPLINPCRDIGRKNESKKLIKSTSEIVAELNSDRDDLLIRRFWDRSTDFIIYVRICDVNQPSYLDRKPAIIINTAEKFKEESLSGALTSVENVEKEIYPRLLCRVKVYLRRKLMSF